MNYKLNKLKNKYDIVIVGAGPGGLAAAKILAENKKDVVVFEKNPVIGKKVCAGGLTVKCVKEFHIPRKLFQRIFKRVIVNFSLVKTKIGFGKEVIFTIKREDLGQWQKNEAEKAGVKVFYNKKVEKINKNFVVVDGKKIFYKCLIGADGSSSVVRNYLKLPREKTGFTLQYKTKKYFKNLEIYINLKHGPRYTWIFPHRDHSYVGTGGDAKYANIKKVKNKFDKFCMKKGIDLNEIEYESWPINCDYRGHEFDNIFLIGDAAGLASELTGEGIYAAMISGEDVAKKILNENYDFAGISEILKIKKIHEKILNIMCNNTIKARVYIFICLMLFKTKKYAKRAFHLFA